MPFEDWGPSLVAHQYNVSAKYNGARSKLCTPANATKIPMPTVRADRERGVLEEIWPHPWQTDTCIGDWHRCKRDIEYKSAKTVVDMLVDIVSKNGNLMLNFPLPNSGMLDDRELKTLSGITDWMAINSDAIYATRPWKISGQSAPLGPPSEDASFNENQRRPFTTEDVRFTKKGHTLYAFVMGWPKKQAIIAALAANSKHAPGKIENVELLGHSGKLKWTRDNSGLKIELPDKPPCKGSRSEAGTGLV